MKNNMPVKKYTLEWYKQQEEKEEKLRNQILARTPRLPKETATQWLRRVNKIYQQRRKILWKKKLK